MEQGKFEKSNGYLSAVSPNRSNYEATCIALNTHKLIDGQTFAALYDVRPKAIKQDLLPGYEPEHWYRGMCQYLT